MNPIKVMVNGIPGNMAQAVAKHVLSDPKLQLIPYSLTGPEITIAEHEVETSVVQLIRPELREKKITEVLEQYTSFISIDYTHPTAVNRNAEFYCKIALPFVMGTTGGDRKLLEDTVNSSSIAAVIAPNMAKQIVGFQAMMEYASNTFPDLFKGYSLSIKESHQKGKADTSGTARAMTGYFNALGTPYSEDDIIKERNPETQQTVWGIPQKYLAGHGWHTYTLVSQDQTVRFQFTHNVNGRDIYAQGTLDAVLYLSNKIGEGAAGKVFTMIDVLKGV
ncbi:MAG: dihydrodipicolinate reductase [Thermodesulfobacteriota bacterium]|nr:dihydrodipicolinate reductase [Thermodesulfobacteriota bacterium]